ncbi:MAG: O-antigen ligase family protein [Armatimonadota bacterium]|nr:O-antigen ligase family protein [Armatimonadota bacterium]
MKKREPISNAVRFILYILLLILPSAFTTITADPTEIKNVILNLGLLAIAVVILVGLISKKSLKIKWTPLDFVILAFLVWNIVSALNAEYQWATRPEAIRIFSHVFVYFLCSRYLGESDKIRNTFSILALSSVIPCIYAIIQRFGLDPIMWAYPSYERVLASFGNPTYFAAYLVLVIPITLLLYLDEENALRRWGLLVLAGMQLACLLWTYSRGPWFGLLLALAIGFGLPILLGTRGFTFKDAKKVGVGVAVLLGITVLVSINGGIFERAKTSLDTKDLSNIQRVLQWRAGYRVFLEHPIIGVGPGALKVYMPEKLTPSFFYTGIATASEHAHNEFIEVAAETGIIGLGIFLLMLGMTVVFALRKSFEKTHTSGVLIGAILGFLVCNLVGVAMRYSVGGVYFWVFLGLLSGLGSWKTHTKDFRTGNGIRLFLILCFALVFLLFICSSVRAVYSFIGSIEQKRADSLFGQNLMEEAIPIYRKVLFINPTNVSAMYNLAICYTAVKEYNSALSTYARLEKLWPDIGRIHFNKGTIYATMGNLSLAKKELERAAKIDGLPDTWEYLSRVYYALGEESKAAEAARNAVQAANKMTNP